MNEQNEPITADLEIEQNKAEPILGSEEKPIEPDSVRQALVGENALSEQIDRISSIVVGTTEQTDGNQHVKYSRNCQCAKCVAKRNSRTPAGDSENPTSTVQTSQTSTSAASSPLFDKEETREMVSGIVELYDETKMTVIGGICLQKGKSKQVTEEIVKLSQMNPRIKRMLEISGNLLAVKYAEFVPYLPEASFGAALVADGISTLVRIKMLLNS